MAKIIRTITFLAFMNGFTSSPVLLAEEVKSAGENAEPYTAFPDLKLPAEGKPEYRETMNALVIAGVLIDLPMKHTPLQKVQYEQVREGLRFYSSVRKSTDDGFWTPADRDMYMSTVDRLYEVAAQLAPDKKEKVRSYKARVLVFKELDRLFEERVSNGSAPSFELDLIRFRRLGAEEALMTLADGAPMLGREPKPFAAKAADLKLDKPLPAYTAFPNLKVPVPLFDKDFRTKMDELVIKDILRDLPKDHSVLERVRYEQVRAGLDCVSKMQTLMGNGKWHVQDYFKNLQIALHVYPAAADLAITAEGKIRCYEASVLVLKEIEAMMETRVEAGNDPSLNLDTARFYRLQAETNLLGIKDRMARQTDNKDGAVEAKSTRQKLDPSVFKNSAFPKLRPVKDKDLETYLDTVAAPIFKEIAVKLPMKYSAIERLRFERVQEGLRSIDNMNKLISQWKLDPNYFPIYSNDTANIFMLAAELQPTNKGKLRCYEAQLVFANMMEKFISDHAKLKSDPSQQSEGARFYRLEAEAQLLKAMDVLGEK